MSWQKIDEHARSQESLGYALAILHADEATNMPPGSGEMRAKAVSDLAALQHERATAPHIAEWIETAKAEDLDTERKLALGEFERLYTNATCLPTDFVRRQSEARMRSEQLWRELRPGGDWKSFAPALENVVAMMREEARMRGEALGLEPYDALMEQFDPGNRVTIVAPVFEDLKAFLKDFLPKVLTAQEERLSRRPLKDFNGPYPVENQRKLGVAAMKAMGFDFNHGRLDVSHHPFCGGAPTDIRMTTRYRTDEFLSSLLAILHETGHALYEQGLPRENAHWPTNHARGMGAHESQSLFVEMQVARGPDFWEWALPLVHEHMGADAIPGWDIEDVLAQVNHVERSLIRVDADEVTYPLHIILRFEMEQELVAGTLAVKDIPEAWNARMSEYLGLNTISDPANGPMQDVHWPAGLFGYFPSYTLGAMMAAQQWAALERDLPDAREQIRNGNFAGINNWRREKIWSQGARWSTPELLTRATGEPLNPDHFKRHLEARYLG